MRPGDTLSLSLAPAAPASLKSCFLGAGGFGSQEGPWHKDSGGQIDPRVGRKEESLGSVLLSPPVAGGVG